MHLIIKAHSSIRCRFCFIYLFHFFFLHLLTLYQLSPLIYFRAGLNQFSFLFFFFLFILTPDKTHCLGGNWSGGSCFVLAVLSGTAINQVIYCVRDGPFSIEFMTCCKKQMLQRYWEFAGYIITARRSYSQRRRAVLHNYFTLTARWGGPNVALSLTNRTWYWFSLRLFHTDAWIPANPKE